MIRYQVVLFFLTVTVASLSGAHHEKRLEFERETPESVGISSQAILDFIQGCENETDAVHSFMIYRHGKLVSDGWWAPHGPDNLHILHSMSKAFTSTAVGIAIGEGLFSLDDKVISFFPEKAPKNPSQNMSNLRIRQLITMQTGHTTSTSSAFRSREDGDWVKRFFEQDPELKPGTYFLYNSGATYMLSAIIQKVTGEKLVDYLRPRLFDKLGIDQFSWEECPKGINVGGWGLFIQTESILRLGVLYNQKGIWNGERILSEEWVKLATSKQVSTGNSPQSDWDQGYGFQFWQSRHGYRGDGKWGQFCFVLPEQDAVIAVTSGNSDMQKIMNLAWDNLLAGMSDNPLPKNPELNRKLEKRSKRLSLFRVDAYSEDTISGDVSGNRYSLLENSIGMKSLDVKFSETYDSLAIVFEEGKEARFRIGREAWISAELEWPKIGAGPQKIASQGAWIAENTYQFKVSFYERCVLMTVTLRFEGEVAIVDVDTNVDYFDEPYPQLVGAKESK